MTFSPDSRLYAFTSNVLIADLEIGKSVVRIPGLVVITHTLCSPEWSQQAEHSMFSLSHDCEKRLAWAHGFTRRHLLTHAVSWSGACPEGRPAMALDASCISNSVGGVHQNKGICRTWPAPRPEKAHVSEKVVPTVSDVCCPVWGPCGL